MRSGTSGRPGRAPVTVSSRLPDVHRRLRARAREAVWAAAQDIQARTTAAMAAPKHGRLYRRPGGRLHQASAPGEAPAIDTTALVQSIQVAWEGELTATVATDRPYAAALEYGTVRMAPRPFFTPAAEGAWPGFVAAMEGLLR